MDGGKMKQKLYVFHKYKYTSLSWTDFLFKNICFCASLVDQSRWSDYPVVFENIVLARCNEIGYTEAIYVIYIRFKYNRTPGNMNDHLILSEDWDRNFVPDKWIFHVSVKAFIYFQRE